MNFSPGHRKSILWLSISYWTSLIIIGAVGTMTNAVMVSFLTFVGLFVFMNLPVSFWLSELTASQWYNEVVLTGVKRIAYSCSQLTRHDPKVQMWWEPLFCIYWSFLIKFINPAILYYIFMGIFIHDLRIPLNGYAVHWQAIGWSIPILGLMIFLGSFCLFSESDQLNYEEFELIEFMTDE